MPLLDDQLKQRLPPRYSQEADDDPLVYARFFLPASYTSWYVIEGEPDGDDFLFFGFVTQPVNRFAEFRLRHLEALRGPKGQTVERDAAFTEGRFTDVVPAPEI